MNGKRVVGVNAKGYRVGEDHHRARLTDGEIAIMRRLRAEGWSLQALADKFEVSKTHAWRVCQRRQRSQKVAGRRVAPLP
jgi:hypothetical protein